MGQDPQTGCEPEDVARLFLSPGLLSNLQSGVILPTPLYLGVRQGLALWLV